MPSNLKSMGIGFFLIGPNREAVRGGLKILQ